MCLSGVKLFNIEILKSWHKKSIYSFKVWHRGFLCMSIKRLFIKELWYLEKCLGFMGDCKNEKYYKIFEAGVKEKVLIKIDEIKPYHLVSA